MKVFSYELINGHIVFEIDGKRVLLDTGAPTVGMVSGISNEPNPKYIPRACTIPASWEFQGIYLCHGQKEKIIKKPKPMDIQTNIRLFERRRRRKKKC